MLAQNQFVDPYFTLFILFEPYLLLDVSKYESKLSHFFKSCETKKLNQNYQFFLFFIYLYFTFYKKILKLPTHFKHVFKVINNI